MCVLILCSLMGQRPSVKFILLLWLKCSCHHINSRLNPILSTHGLWRSWFTYSDVYIYLCIWFSVYAQLGSDNFLHKTWWCQFLSCWIWVYEFGLRCRLMITVQEIRVFLDNWNVDARLTPTAIGSYISAFTSIYYRFLFILVFPASGEYKMSN